MGAVAQADEGILLTILWKIRTSNRLGTKNI